MKELYLRSKVLSLCVIWRASSNFLQENNVGNIYFYQVVSEYLLTQKYVTMRDLMSTFG